MLHQEEAGPTPKVKEVKARINHQEEFSVTLIDVPVVVKNQLQD